MFVRPYIMARPNSGTATARGKLRCGNGARSIGARASGRVAGGRDGAARKGNTCSADIPDGALVTSFCPRTRSRSRYAVEYPPV
ncbi:unnamed protein product, partial [Iphiclides podalirius]